MGLKVSVKSKKLKSFPRKNSRLLYYLCLFQLSYFKFCVLILNALFMNFDNFVYIIFFQYLTYVYEIHIKVVKNYGTQK